MTPQIREVAVHGDTPYRIRIGAGLLADGAGLAAHIRGRHVLIVSDDQVAPLYLQHVHNALIAARPDLVLASHVFAAGEASKTLDSFAGVIDALARMGATRDACVLALGGGVVGDMAGFAAACWMRTAGSCSSPSTPCE